MIFNCSINGSYQLGGFLAFQKATHTQAVVIVFASVFIYDDYANSPLCWGLISKMGQNNAILWRVVHKSFLVRLATSKIVILKGNNTDNSMLTIHIHFIYEI